VFQLTMNHLSDGVKLKLCSELLDTLKDALDHYEQVHVTLLEEQLSHFLVDE